MKPIMRRYKDENDFWRIRQFLREVLRANDLRELSWTVARLDYWRWHCIENCNHSGPVEEVTFLWETQDGQLAAVLNPEETGVVYLQMHPALRTRELEEEMVELAEEHLPRRTDGKCWLAITADSEDRLRQSILQARGYQRGGDTESQWRRDLDTPIPNAPIANSYTIRSLGEESELPARSWASWRGFHPKAPDDEYEGWTWYRNLQRCPLYRRDLDIVAATADGTIAAFCTFWYDDVTRTAYIEPVATVPEHQRRGLARAVIAEGLRRVQRMGAVRAFVGGLAPGPNALYSSVLSPVGDRAEEWIKEW